MAPTNSKATSQYAEAKAGLASLAKQTGQVALFFLIFLLLTGGAPSPLLLSLSFCAGVGFIAWRERQRLAKSDEPTVLPNPKQAKTRIRTGRSGRITVQFHREEPVSKREKKP